MIARNTITCSDALAYTRALPDESLDCIITSPPYFGLRDYGVDGQWGNEGSVQDYVSRLVDLFAECRRALKPTGTLWLNLGDSYGGQKQLLGIPWRVALALQDDGWILRSDIIWHKPNPMPESVTDRCTVSHEYVFMLAKRPRYFYDADAVRERHSREWWNETVGAEYMTAQDGGKRKGNGTPSGRNKRSVWTIPLRGFPGAHFATFPLKLVEPMILAGCPRQVCAACGAPVERVVEVGGGTIGKSWVPHNDDKGKGMSQYSGLSGGVGNAKDKDGNRYTRTTKGWRPTCDCNAATIPGLVFDPFMGAGTVALVARAHKRDYIGCELNPEYVDMANKRLNKPYQTRLFAYEDY